MSNEPIRRTLGQSDAAAERSAHVERGPERRFPGEDLLAEVGPGIYRLRAVVEAERARADEVAALREALRPFAAAADSLDPWDRDRAHIWEHAAAMAIEVGHLRAARAALGESER